MIDNCVDQVYDLIKDKTTGIGIIRISDNGPISEYYSTLDKKIDSEKNLCIINVKDNINRHTIRQTCIMRYTVMRNENNIK